MRARPDLLHAECEAAGLSVLTVRWNENPDRYEVVLAMGTAEQEAEAVSRAAAFLAREQTPAEIRAEKLAAMDVKKLIELLILRGVIQESDL